MARDYDPIDIFAYSSPFGIGPVAEAYYEGRVSFDWRGYAAWGSLSIGLERIILGTTKFRVYAPVVASAFTGPTGLLTAFPSLGVATAAAGIVGASAAIAAAVVSVTPDAHRTSFTGQFSGKYFDY